MTECIGNTFAILTFKLIETQWKLKNKKATSGFKYTNEYDK